MLISKDVSLTYTNKRGASLSLAPFSAYSLISCDEILENNINAEKLNYQHGEEFVSCSLAARRIEISGFLGTITKRREMRHEMERVFNPTVNGSLMYCNNANNARFTIDCLPEGLPEIVFNKNAVYFTISLVCHDPFWRGTEVTEHISMIDKRGFFPLILPEDALFVFGYRADTLQTTFDNLGDSTAGATYVLTAEGGTVLNPSITHVESGRKVRLKYAMEDGDSIKVISMHGFVSIVINDTINGMPFLDFNPAGNFFLLEFGLNTIAYNADENAVNLSVSVMYDPLYLGVE